MIPLTAEKASLQHSPASTVEFADHGIVFPGPTSRWDSVNSHVGPAMPFARTPSIFAGTLLPRHWHYGSLSLYFLPTISVFKSVVPAR